jgi:Cytosine deaminase and related metal-dependent hydrolases
VEGLRLNVGAAFLGKDLEYVERVNVVVEEEEITHIGRGYDDGAKDYRGYVLFPPLVNSHSHLADSAFPEYGVNLTIKEVVGDPKSEKYRLFGSVGFERLREAIGKALRESLRRGVFAVIDFREQGLEGLRLVQEFRKDREIVYLALGRLDEFDEDSLMKLRELGDGYGLPSASASEEELRAIRRAFSDKLRAAHVSETLRHYLTNDLERLLNSYDPNLIVHATRFTYKDFQGLSVPVVFCPRSNLWLGVGVPKIADAIRAGVKVLFGTDNAGLNTVNIWKDLELALLITRMQGPTSDYSDEILKGATYHAYELLGLNWGLEEGREARLVLVPGEGIFEAINKRTALIKRASERPLIAFNLKGLVG